VEKSRDSDDLVVLKRRMAAASGLSEEEYNRRWDEFMAKAVTIGLTKEEEDRHRREFRDRQHRQ